MNFIVNSSQKSGQGNAVISRNGKTTICRYACFNEPVTQDTNNTSTNNNSVLAMKM